jgi:hypothetical protein
LGPNRRIAMTSAVVKMATKYRAPGEGFVVFKDSWIRCHDAMKELPPLATPTADESQTLDAVVRPKTWCESAVEPCFQITAAPRNPTPGEEYNVKMHNNGRQKPLQFYLFHHVCVAAPPTPPALLPLGKAADTRAASHATGPTKLTTKRVMKARDTPVGNRTNLLRRQTCC